jgi:hypothetical protein
VLPTTRNPALQEHTPENLRENTPFFDTYPAAPGEEQPALTYTYGVV